MFYLTVHDLVWLNSVFCGPDVPHDYERLEAAMAAQYGYGDSRDVLNQAASFAEKMIGSAPFREGNLRTGLLAVSVFLAGNGLPLHASDGVAQAVREIATSSGDGHVLLSRLLPAPLLAPEAAPPATTATPAPSVVRSLARAARNAIGGALAELESEDGPVPGWHASPYLHRD